MMAASQRHNKLSSLYVSICMVVVLGKISSRSNSTQSFDEALREAEAQKAESPVTDMTSQDPAMDTTAVNSQPSLS